MKRTAFAREQLLDKFAAWGKVKRPTYGLILGQPFETNYYVLHLAKTPLSQSADEPKTVSDIDDVSLIEHARHTTRMLVGGMYVLGVFVVADENILEPLTPKLKTVANSLSKYLHRNHLMFGSNEGDDGSMVLLHYMPSTKSHSALSYNGDTSVINGVRFEFKEVSNVWCPVDCKFEIDMLMPIGDDDLGTPLKTLIKNQVNHLNELLKSSIVMFDGEIKKDNAIITPKLKVTEFEEVTHATILLPPDGMLPIKETKICDSLGYIKVKGTIASFVCMHSKTPYAIATAAIKEDIVRSIAARLEMHFDSLTEGERSFFYDANCVHEPPRRVLITFPETNAAFSDYLFPGEGTQEAELSFQDVLDINIAEENYTVNEIEGQQDIAEFYDETRSQESQEMSCTKIPSDANKMVYVLGAIFALGVLVVSLIIEYTRHY